MTSFYLIIAFQILYSRHVCSPLAMILKQTQSGPWKQNCQIDNRPTCRWYNGEHSCLPSSWPGFDSRPTQCCLCLIFCFLLRLLLSVRKKPVTWGDRAKITRLQRTNNKTNISNKQDAINFIYSWKRSAQMHVSANSQFHANVRKRGIFSTTMLDVFLKRSNKSKMVRRPGIEPGSTAWKAAMFTTIPQTPHENIYFDILIRTLGQKIILGTTPRQYISFSHSDFYQTFTH